MDPAELIPHAGPMCWLDRVVAHSAQKTRCALVVRASTPLAGTARRVPRISVNTPQAMRPAVFPIAKTITPAGAARSGLAVFDTCVRDSREREVASARLNLYADLGEA